MSLIGTAGTQPAGAEDVCFLGYLGSPVSGGQDRFLTQIANAMRSTGHLCALRFAPSLQTAYSILAASFYRRCRLSEIAPIRPFLNFTGNLKWQECDLGLSC
jgi:hypothetical protein